MSADFTIKNPKAKCVIRMYVGETGKVRKVA